MLRVLVAMLGVMAGRVVPDEALVDGLWGEDWSRERERNLHTHVSALRRRLAAAEPGRGGSRVVRSGGGYRLVLAETEVDAGWFQSLAGQGRQAARAGEVAAAAGLFAQALGLWRGAALADVVGLCPRLAGDAATLEELRAGVVEERVACDLALGRHGEVAGKGTGLVAEFPLRERLAGQVMVALYRCGRRGEALALFDSTRRVLGGELGLIPGRSWPRSRRRCWPMTHPWPHLRRGGGDGIRWPAGECVDPWAGAAAAADRNRVLRWTGGRAQGAGWAAEPVR